MKDSKTLLTDLYTITSLREAWDSLNKSNKTSRGISGLSLEDFSKDLDRNLIQIQSKLKTSQYKFQAIKAVRLPKKGKLTDRYFRPIRVQEIQDRVVLKALAILLEKELSETFKLKNGVSFGYRKNSGVFDAIYEMAKQYKAGNVWILEADIKNFFDSVDRQGLLTSKIYPALRDDSINDLLLAGLTQEIGNKDQLNELQLYEFEASSEGIPQGSSLSPLLSNICLSDFDQRMIEEGLALIRYADDFVVMCRERIEAERAYNIACQEMTKLNLELYKLEDENSKTRIVHPGFTPFSFLSIRFNGVELWPSEKKLTELKEKIRATTNTTSCPDVLTMLSKTRNLLYGWLASFSFYDVDRYFITIDNYINSQLFHALRQFNWTLKKVKTSKEKNGVSIKEITNALTIEQRKRSGILTCEEFFSQIMNDRKKIDVGTLQSVEFPTFKVHNQADSSTVPVPF